MNANNQSVDVGAIDINASLLKLSAETHKSVDDAICALQKLEGIEPIPVQWWSIVSMALYNAYLLGEAEQDRTKPVQPVAAPVEKSRHMIERWNIEWDNDDLIICFNDHEKHEQCQDFRYVPASRVLSESVNESENFELVATVHPNHILNPDQVWCRNVLLYSAKNTEYFPENRVNLYALRTKPKPVSDDAKLSRKHTFVRSTLKHHGIDWAHTALVADLIHGLEDIDSESTPTKPFDEKKHKKLLADLHLYEEITQYYAKCNPTPESLRDWVSERMYMPAQPLEIQKAIACFEEIILHDDQHAYTGRVGLEALQKIVI